MKHPELWQSSRICGGENGKDFSVDISRVYAGSVHVSRLQFEALRPLLVKYCNGKLLDAGCGKVPYYRLLKNHIGMHYCIDYSENPEVHRHLDEVVDLNTNFSLKEKDFDCVLLCDVLAHVADPSRLLSSLAVHLKSGGRMIISTPFVYWISEYPHEYFHPTEFALKKMLTAAGFQIEYIMPYGGYPDVLLDTINKGMTGALSNRLFRLLASVVKKTSSYRKSNEKTMYSYPIGYSVVARKL
jgi:SAM-dependent methyltransferase